MKEQRKKERKERKMKEKRRRLDGVFKAKMGLNGLKGIKTVAEIARQYQIHPNQVSQWKSEIARRLPEVFESGPTVVAQEQEKQIARLERKIGQLTMDLEWLQ